LLNSCGSAFETVYQSPFVLKGTVKSGEDATLSGTYDTDLKVMIISDSKNKILAHIKDDMIAGDHNVLVTKKDGVSVQPKYSCTNLQEIDEDGIYTYSVDLTALDQDGSLDDNAPVNNLTWTVNKTQTLPELLSISVTKDGDELLKLEADSE